LISFTSSRNQRDEGKSKQATMAIIEYSEELAELIQEKLTQYASLSQLLDRNFPLKLVEEVKTLKLKKEKIIQDISDLEEKRTRLINVGLLDKAQEINFKKLLTEDKEIDRSLDVLGVYLDDVKQKLAIFDDLADKIELLLKIINNKFIYKQMSVSKNTGFVLKNSSGDELKPYNLSSGEQHELIILYELLFKIKENSLILIDEPEISLHVVWQQQFLRDLNEIIKLAKLNILIATHSPQIIHDRWDLTLQLKGPNG
jgi:predicted ATP-binding protein involved in virulence